jgi:hypothetical protein
MQLQKVKCNQIMIYEGLGAIYTVKHNTTMYALITGMSL